MPKRSREFLHIPNRSPTLALRPLLLRLWQPSLNDLHPFFTRRMGTLRTVRNQHFLAMQVAWVHERGLGSRCRILLPDYMCSGSKCGTEQGRIIPKRAYQDLRRRMLLCFRHTLPESHGGIGIVARLRHH